METRYIKYKIWNELFIIQSYKDNEFVNLCWKYSIKLDFNTRKILTNEKEDAIYNNWLKELNIDFDNIINDMRWIFIY